MINLWKHILCYGVFILLSLGLLACQGKVKDQTPAAPLITPEPTPIVIIPTRVRLESRLLAQAEDAFRQARYTTPKHDNAYDKFHSVLLINPGNKKARAGLQAILLRYAELTRDALRSGRLSSARKYLRQAELYYPANPLVLDLKKAITEAQRWVPPPVVAKSAAPEHDEIPLSKQALSGKTAEVKELLTAVASRIKESHESVLIFARSDREGRWIYKQLKQAASGYRVRGDIRISRQPKIRILPPL